MAAKSQPSVKVHFANGGRSMATSNKGGSKKGGKRASGKRKPKSNPKANAGRRRNPSGFVDRAAKLLGGAAVVIGTGVGVTYAMAKIKPGTAASMYGIPLATFGLGVALARKSPTLGVGMALGAGTPYVIPFASKALALGQPSAQTATAGLGRVLHTLRAVQMGAVQRPMGAIDSRYRAYA